MTGEDGYGDGLASGRRGVVQDGDRRRRRTPRRRYVKSRSMREMGEGLEAGTAYHSDVDRRWEELIIGEGKFVGVCGPNTEGFGGRTIICGWHIGHSEDWKINVSADEKWVQEMLKGPV